MAACWDGCSLRWLLVGMAASDSSYFADFEQVKNFSCHFADFNQVKIFSRHFAEFEQVKKTSNKTPAGETGCLCIFFCPWPHVTTLHPGFSDL